MLKIDKTNYRQIEPGFLAEGLSNGTIEIVENSVAGLVEIVKHISAAVGERKMLKRRVEVLESTAKAQQELNNKILSALNQPI